jgi:hypothetical protein
MSRLLPRFRRTNPPLPVPTNNVYEVVLQGNLQNQETLSTFYYRDANPKGTAQAPASLATRFTAVVVPAFAAVCATNWTGVGLIVRTVTDPTTPSLVSNFVAPVPGTVAGDSDGTIPAATLVRQTGFRGQTGRGHVNMPAVPATFVNATGESLTPAALAAYLAFIATAFTTPLLLGGNTYTPGLLSRGTRTQMPKVLGYADIDTGFPRTVLGTARRRKLFRGK